MIARVAVSTSVIEFESGLRTSRVSPLGVRVIGELENLVDAVGDSAVVVDQREVYAIVQIINIAAARAKRMKNCLDLAYPTGSNLYYVPEYPPHTKDDGDQGVMIFTGFVCCAYSVAEKDTKFNLIRKSTSSINFARISLTGILLL